MIEPINTTLCTILQNIKTVKASLKINYTKPKQLCGPVPNVMAALPYTGGALCSTPQFGCAITLPRRETR